MEQSTSLIKSGCLSVALTAVGVLLMLHAWPAGAVEGRCVAFCGSGSSSNSSGGSWGGSQSAPATDPRHDRATELNNEALRILKQNKFQEAVRLLNEALALNPGNSTIRRNLGLAYNEWGVHLANQGNWVMAHQMFVEALKYHPENARFRENEDLARYKVEEPRREREEKQRLAEASNRVAGILADLERDLNRSDRFEGVTSPVQGERGLSFMGTDGVEGVTSPVQEKRGLNFMGTDTRDTAASVAPASSAGDQTAAKSTKGLRIREVPLPPDVQARIAKHDLFGGTPYGWTQRADLILDALRQGDGDLGRSYNYLRDRVLTQGRNFFGTDALSFVEGLYRGALAKGEDCLDKWNCGLRIQLIDTPKSRSWPGPENPNPGAREPNPHAWETKRSQIVLDALEAGRNLRESVTYLQERVQADPWDRDVVNAYYYLLGVEAYAGPDDKASAQGK